MADTFLTDALAHTFAGIAAALLDFASSKVATPSAKRLSQKQQCLAAIDALLDSEPATAAVAEDPSAPPRQRLAKDSLAYAEQINIARDYLCAAGFVKLELPFFQRALNGIRNVVKHEKINNLAPLQKLWVALGVESIYNLLFGFYFYTNILKKSPVIAVAVTLYQIPAFWAGLWLGGGLKTVLNYLFTSGDEKKLDAAIQQLLQRTPIVNIVVNYRPPETVQQSLLERGSALSAAQLTRVGQGAFQQIKQFAENAQASAADVLNYPEKQRAKEQQARDERKKRFDDLTQGR